MSDPDFFIVTSLLGNVASFRASPDMRKGARLVKLEDHHARIAELQAQVEQLRTEAKVASDRIQELGRFTKAQRGEVEGLRADAERLDWLTEQLVDTIYLDDGHIIDVGTGRIGSRDVCVSPHDLRAAIDSARAGREDGNGR